MIRTVLVDDEPDSIRVLQRMLEDYCPEVSIIGRAVGVESALQLIRTTDPDLAFLDIEMIQGNAFDLLNRLQSITFQIIFVTAFDNYAIRAFKYSAVDYLLKPVDVDDLRSAVAKVICHSKERVDMGKIRTLLENVGCANLSQQKMAVPTMTGLNFIAIQSIIRFEARENYTAIHLDNGECILATKNLGEYEEIMPESIFFRVHTSHLINLLRMLRYQKGRGGCVIMEDGAEIEVASRRREDFLKRLFK